MPPKLGRWIPALSFLKSVIQYANAGAACNFRAKNHCKSHI